jgi:ribosomal protein S18 acetylase RimI-like enzyme
VPPAIRPFRTEDRTTLVALWELCELTRPWNDPNFDIDRKLVRDPANLLVLDDDASGELIGSVMVGYEGHRGWLNYLAVHPAHRHRGFGRLLVAHAEQRLRELGCPKVNLQVRTSNHGALLFYRRIGYAVDDTVSLGRRLETLEVDRRDLAADGAD